MLNIFPTPGTPSEGGIKFLKTSKISTFFQKDYYSESLYHAVTFYVAAKYPASTIFVVVGLCVAPDVIIS